MTAFTWKSVVGAALILLALQQGLARMKAVGRADAEADNVERLTADLAELSRDTVRLSRRLNDLDTTHREEEARDSILIAGLRTRTMQYARELSDYRSQDSLYAADIDDSFKALAARINPEDVPALRVVIALVNTRVVGLQSQVAVQARWLEDSRTELRLVITDRDRLRVARSAADELTNGLRITIRRQAAIINAQARETDALRDAVGGFRVTIQGWWLLPVGAVLGALAVGL